MGQAYYCCLLKNSESRSDPATLVSDSRKFGQEAAYTWG